jgi:hypothetical protein
MSQLATAEPSSVKAPSKRAREPRIPANIKRACELLASGECKTVTAAAERVGVSREWLSKLLQRSHVQAFAARKAAETIQRGVFRAAGRFVELVDAESEHVAAKVSERLLEHGGILKAQHGGGVNISISNNISPGYVIDLAGQASGPVVDMTGSALTHDDR